MTGAPTSEQLADEARRVRKLRQLVDIATVLIMQSNMTVDDAESLVRWLRQRVLALFPDGAETFEVIYAPRFRRLISEYSVGRPPGVVIPFPQRRSEAG
jgi:hypothetical protein